MQHVQGEVIYITSVITIVSTALSTTAMYIGFGNGTYIFTKGVQYVYKDTVRLVKEDGVVSEQIFKITVIAQSNAVEQEATYTIDYSIGPMLVQTFIMTPDQQYLPIGVEIYDTGLTGTLKAQLSSSQQPNTPSFSARYNPITQLVILDNKGWFVQVIM